MIRQMTVGGIAINVIDRAPSVPGEAAIVLALTALLTIAPLVPPARALPVAAAVAVLTVLAWHRRAPAGTSVGILFIASVLIGVAGLGPQQVILTGAFAVYFVVVRRVRWLHGAATWLRRGSLSWGAVSLAAGIAAISGGALLAWYRVATPDLADLVRTFVPDWPLGLLVPGALLLSLINAALEEAAYRGVVLEALDTILGPSFLSIVLQAAAFGALHFYGGFPRGAVGVGLAFIYGLAIGALRRKTNGLIVPWIAHVFTDLVVFSIVLTLARA
jgi:CAAX protease family protein